MKEALQKKDATNAATLALLDPHTLDWARVHIARTTGYPFPGAR